MHFTPFPNLRCLTSVFPSKLFSPALSPLSYVVAHDWNYPFSAPLATAITIFAFFCNYILHSGQAECHIFPVIFTKTFFLKKLKTPENSLSRLLLKFAPRLLCKTQNFTLDPLNNNPPTKLQTRFHFSVFCPVFPEIFSQQAYNSLRSRPSS